MPNVRVKVYCCLIFDYRSTECLNPNVSSSTGSFAVRSFVAGSVEKKGHTARAVSST